MPYVAVGPDNLAVGAYKVEIVFQCRFDGTEMGRTIRYTAPEMDNTTETTRVPGTSVIPVAQSDDGFRKWRFTCTECGHDVLKADSWVEAAMDHIYAPWARRVERVRI